MFYFNDVWYNARPKYWRGNKPLFVLKNGQLELTNVPVPKPRPLSLRASIERWLGENICLYTLTEKVKSAFTTSKEVTNELPTDWGVFSENPEPSTVESWDMTEHLLIKLSQETSRLLSDLLVVYIPFRSAV